MKKNMIFILAGLLCVSVSCSSDDSSEPEAMMMVEVENTEARTEIPDIAFEQALIELGFDDVQDGSVLTDNVSEITEIVLDNKGISDLTGLEDFIMLEGLWASNNMLSSLDVTAFSNLLFLFVADNDLSSLKVAGLGLLEKIDANNNSLSELDLSGNLGLQLLLLKDNDLNEMDVSFITNPLQLNQFDVEGNPLDCIKVNASQLDNIPAQWNSDPEDTYSLDCN